MTILRHVGDLKISHVDAKEVMSVLDKLQKQFEKLRTLRGNKHTYLGMKLDCSKEGNSK